MANDDDVLTWREVGRLAKAKGRGAPYQLAVALGMNSSYFYRRVKGDGELTERQARVVRAFLADAPTPIEPDTTATDSPSVKVRRIPVYGYTLAGRPGHVVFGGPRVLDFLDPPPFWNNVGEIVYVRIPDGRMHPRYKSGEIAAVKLDLPPGHGNDCLVEMKDGTGVVRTYQGERDGQVWVEEYGENPRTYGIPSDDVKARHAIWRPGMV